jgi:hypothetical protein
VEWVSGICNDVLRLSEGRDESLVEGDLIFGSVLVHRSGRVGMDGIEVTHFVTMYVRGCASRYFCIIVLTKSERVNATSFAVFVIDTSIGFERRTVNIHSEFRILGLVLIRRSWEYLEIVILCKRKKKYYAGFLSDIPAI